MSYFPLLGGGMEIIGENHIDLGRTLTFHIECDTHSPSTWLNEFQLVSSHLMFVYLYLCMDED